MKRVDQAFDFFGIPAGHTFFSAVYLAVVGSALLRGKRAALLWVLWVFEALWLLAQTAAVAFTSVRLANPNDAGTAPRLRAARPSRTWSGASSRWSWWPRIIVLLWKIRGAFPARLAPGTPAARGRRAGRSAC